jgi:hypothetical protein
VAGLIREAEDHASTEEVSAEVAGACNRLLSEARQEDPELSVHQRRVAGRLGS